MSTIREGFVVRNRDGSQKTDAEANWTIDRICRKTGLPIHYWHTLRHSFGNPRRAVRREPVAPGGLDGPQAHRGDDAVRPPGGRPRPRAARGNSRRSDLRGRRADHPHARCAWHICATNRKKRGRNPRNYGRLGRARRGLEPPRCYPLAPQSQRTAAISAFYTLTHTRQRRFPQRVQTVVQLPVATFGSEASQRSFV